MVLSILFVARYTFPKEPEPRHLSLKVYPFLRSAIVALDLMKFAFFLVFLSSSYFFIIK